MKIGIINFHCAHNYGAMLQAYALQKYLQEEGNNTTIIDFQPDIIIGGYQIWNKNKFLHPKRFLGTLKNYKKLKFKYDVFEKFKNQYMNTTPKIYKRIDKDILKDLGIDTFLCGSDQVWNMDLNGGLTEYLLSFVQPNKHIKRISYAASIGTKKISEKNKKIMEKELKYFHAISVREDDAVGLIKDNFNLEAKQVLDPVFLLDKEKWNQVAKRYEGINKKYVLLYGLEENELFEKTFKFLKENTDLEIINISPAKKISKYIDKTLYDVGPSEFIGLIRDAEIVFTNSFHGTCFSIMYNKKFFTIGHSELNSRIESILRLTKLEKHLIKTEILSVNQLESIINTDFTEVNNILKNEIKNSKAFLLEALK